MNDPTGSRGSVSGDRATAQVRHGMAVSLHMKTPGHNSGAGALQLAQSTRNNWVASGALSDLVFTVWVTNNQDSSKDGSMRCWVQPAQDRTSALLFKLQLLY